MKMAWKIAGMAVALALVGSATPQRAEAAKQGSVCQFYKGDPLCKTVVDENCVGVSVGLEGRHCTRTTEYWYWS